MTLEGETEAAAFACWVGKAACTAGGRGVAAGRERPSAQRTRMVKRPVREVGLPSGFAGVGVVERGGSSVPAERVAVEVFFVSFPRPLSMVDGEERARLFHFPGTVNGDHVVPVKDTTETDSSSG